MKLYTDKTVRDLIGRLDPLLRGNDWCELYDSLTPIELPSDEEIKNEAKKYTESTPDNDPIRIMTFIQSAKWVLEQIKQQDNETIYI